MSMSRWTRAALTIAAVAAVAVVATATGVVLPGRGSSGHQPSVPVPDYDRVLIEADFDELPPGPFSPGEFVQALGGGTDVVEAYDDSAVVPDPRGQGNIYRVTLEAGSFQQYPPGNNGIVTFVPLDEVVEEACVSYDLRFSDDFDWSLGGKLPGLQGTLPGVELSTPTGGGNPGERGWSSRGMWLGPDAYSWAGPNNMAVSYVYGPEQAEHYGDNVRWDRAYEAGRWHEVVQCHTMNSVGEADGTLRAWMDGDLVLNVQDHVYRLREDLGITHLNWSVFRGGDSVAWAGDSTGYVEIDNLKVTAE